MGFTIAVSGKGGTGKTTISGLIIKYLNERFKTPVLAIDADPNMNLNEVLGVKIEHTIGSIREKTKEESENLANKGISKIEYINLMINQALIEGNKVDLLVMGRPEGSGCYCAANHLIRRTIDELGSKYKFVVIDNEAGMEHLSRHTTENVDILFIISDSSWRGLQAGIRIRELVKELNLNIKQIFLIINRVNNNSVDTFIKKISGSDINILGVIPEDELVTKYDMEGIPLAQLSKESKIVSSLYSLLDNLTFTTKDVVINSR